MGLFFKTPSEETVRISVPRMRLAMRDLAMIEPPKDDVALNSVIEQHALKVKTERAGKEPRWWVFVCAALLIVVVIIVEVYVATAADAQVNLPTSQLKTLSGNLMTILSGLTGAVIGMITGEAVSKQ
jgi:hypothetical protein